MTKSLEASTYPRVTQLGLTINRNGGPPGINTAELAEILGSKGLYDSWVQWALGITVAENGFYPWDVESFLSGMPLLNVDTGYY